MFSCIGCTVAVLRFAIDDFFVKGTSICDEHHMPLKGEL